MERLPAYAPDLDPNEGVWRYLQRVELRNRCGQNKEELRWEFQLATRRLRRKPAVIRACFRLGRCDGYRKAAGVRSGKRPPSASSARQVR